MTTGLNHELLERFRRGELQPIRHISVRTKDAEKEIPLVHREGRSWFFSLQDLRLIINSDDEEQVREWLRKEIQYCEDLLAGRLEVAEEPKNGDADNTFRGIERGG